MSGRIIYNTLAFHTLDYYPVTVPKFANGEVPGGTVNGSNVTFTLASAPNPSLSLMLYVNGALQSQVPAAGPAPVDYTLSGSTITFTYPPQANSTILAWYMH